MRLLIEWYILENFWSDLQKSRENCGTCFTSYFTFSSAASCCPYNIIDSYLNGLKIFYKKLPAVNLLILALLPEYS